VAVDRGALGETWGKTDWQPAYLKLQRGFYQHATVWSSRQERSLCTPVVSGSLASTETTLPLILSPALALHICRRHSSHSNRSRTRSRNSSSSSDSSHRKLRRDASSSPQPSQQGSLRQQQQLAALLPA
jgi:hypothetical protein